MCLHPIIQPPPATPPLLSAETKLGNAELEPPSPGRHDILGDFSHQPFLCAWKTMRVHQDFTALLCEREFHCLVDLR